VYVTDSGGRLTMNEVRDRVRAYRDVLDPGTQIGIHAHENLPVGRELRRGRRGGRDPRRRLARRAGAGAGNCPIGAFIAVANLHGWEHGCDVFALQDAADALLRPLQDRVRSVVNCVPCPGLVAVPVTDMPPAVLVPVWRASADDGGIRAFIEIAGSLR
jgi:hypothetical protein